MQLSLLRDSFAQVIEREALITPRFYQILFARYPQVRPLFGHNAAARQQQMLQEALVAVLDHLEDAQWLEQTLGGMGAKHVAYGVTDEMYPWVGECLIATLAEIMGAAWTPAHDEAWRAAYGAITTLMLRGAAATATAAA